MKRLLIARGFVLLFASLDTVAMVYPQTAPPSEAPANALSVPEDTTFLAALTTPIAIDQAKLNDAVEAVTSQDIKKGHDVVLKKDATLLGRVDWIDAATSVPKFRPSLPDPRSKPIPFPSRLAGECRVQPRTTCQAVMRALPRAPSIPCRLPVMGCKICRAWN
jgi:hypothetical protein